ncbi:unnamed protein product [Tilletia caries]|nr:unnamed protein product [Tilletia caries]
MRNHGKRHLHVPRREDRPPFDRSASPGPSSSSRIPIRNASAEVNDEDRDDSSNIGRNLDPDAELPSSKRRLDAGRKAASALIDLSQREVRQRHAQAVRNSSKRATTARTAVLYQPDDDFGGLQMEEVVIVEEEEDLEDGDLESVQEGAVKSEGDEVEVALFREEGAEEELVEMEDVDISDVEPEPRKQRHQDERGDEVAGSRYPRVKREVGSDEEHDIVFVAETSSGIAGPSSSQRPRSRAPPRTPSPPPQGPATRRLPTTTTTTAGPSRPLLNRTTSSQTLISAENDVTAGTEEGAEGAGSRRAGGNPRRRPAGRKGTEQTLLTRTEPWPEHFLQLQQTFKAINVVHTFCSGRKHLAPTFNTMKSSVESYTGRPLEVFDLAQLKSLCPDLINFAYVDADLLQVHLDGSAAVSTASTSGSSANMAAQTVAGSSASNRRMERDNVYAQALEDIQRAEREAMGIMESDHHDDEEGEEDGFGDGERRRKEKGKGKEREKPASDHVLLFDFNDGTTSGPKARGSGKRPGFARGPVNDKRMLKRPLLNSLPSGHAMTKLIEKRNQKFEQAVIELLNACDAKDEEPVQLVIEAAQSHLPVDPSASRLADSETPRKKRIKLQHLMDNPDARSAIADIIDEFKLAKWWNDQIVPGGRKTLPARQASYGELAFSLSQNLVDALWNTRRIEKFYTHQAQALNALDEGKNVIICTSTSSGKSLVYQVPVLRALEEDRASTAIYIFPTKALSQDQQRSLQDLLQNYEGLEDVVVSTYDGDLAKEDRREVRDNANVIFTNPDMLHQSILPFEDKWRRFFENLRFVVVDELHIYNGLFGTHVGFILRRLRRLCHAYGNERVQFVSCSATVSNPADHMSAIVGVENVEVVTEDGSPVGKKEWVIWNPPQIDPNDPAQGRVSAYEEASKVFRHLVEHGVRTILFCKVRRTCEIVIRQIRNDLALDGRQDVANKVMAYRSGYSPQDRRKIEQDMFKGQLLGIVATTALELGIDIGTLDAVVMLGFPYSISGLRQQAGRAGRRQKDSLALLIGEPWPMDQHYMRFPEEIFSQPDAALTVDLTNDFVVEAHLQCAAAEMPVRPADDAAFFGPSTEKICKTRLTVDGKGFYHCRDDLLPAPARDVAIRGARQESYSYIDDTPGRAGGPRVMEQVEIERAIFEAFEGAVFMHQGHSYLCRSISHDQRVARMYRAEVNYHTRPRDFTDTDAVETYRIRSLRESPYKAYFGRVVITNKVWGYFKVDRRANILDSVDVDCPPFVRETRGMWLDVPMWLVQALTEKTINAAAAIHAAEHALLSLTPMFVVSIAGDVQTECKIAEKEYAKKVSTRRRPARLIFYDLPGQNAGICERAFEHLDALIRIAIAVIEACHCSEGCPGCVTSQTCAYANVVTSKVGALAVLRGLVGREMFDGDLPQQNDLGHGAAGQLDRTGSALTHTIREASPVRGEGPLETEEIEEQMPEALYHFSRLAAEHAAEREAAGTASNRGQAVSLTSYSSKQTRTMTTLNNNNEFSAGAIAGAGLSLFAASALTYPLETSTIAFKTTYQPLQARNSAIQSGQRDSVVLNTYDAGVHLVKTSPHGLFELFRGLIPYTAYSLLFSSGFTAFLGVFPHVNPIPNAPAALEVPRNLALASFRALLQPIRTLYSRQITRKAARKLSPVTPSPVELWKSVTDEEERRSPYLLFKPSIMALEFLSTAINAISNYALLTAVPVLYTILVPGRHLGPADNFHVRGQSARNADPLPIAVLAAYTAGGIALRLASEAVETVSLRLSAQTTGKLPAATEVEPKVSSAFGQEPLVLRPQPYKGPIDAFSSIYKEEGLVGLTRGWGVSLFFTGAQIAAVLGFTELRLRGRI